MERVYRIQIDLVTEIAAQIARLDQLLVLRMVVMMRVVELVAAQLLHARLQLGQRIRGIFRGDEIRKIGQVLAASGIVSHAVVRMGAGVQVTLIRVCETIPIIRGILIRGS